MNKLMKKAAALITAGLMAAASLSAEAFAEGAQTLKKANTVVAYEAGVAKPTYTVKGSDGVRKIKLSSATSGATIYYTVNGSVPTTSSRLYKNGTLLKITKDIKIRAIAVYGGISSDIMNKTFKVDTKFGDVTGDGNINSNDAARLTNYLAGRTTFICTDNADCNANGSVSNNDLTILQQYLRGNITRLPYTGSLYSDDPEDPEEDEPVETVTSIPKPGITVYKSLGGKRVEFKSSVSGVTFYYTLDGSTPTTRSTRYTDKFLIDTAGTKTVRVIAYKDGAVSGVQQTTVTVGQTSAVTCGNATNTIYDSNVVVMLNCATADSTIYYTTDGTDPRTSSTAKVYNPNLRFTIYTTSTIKAYACSKSNANSDVLTVTLKVNADFVITGTVWNDTYFTGSSADGMKATGEPGISGIRVLAYNVDTNTFVRETTTDANGAYTLNGLMNGNRYKVYFRFNGQKYRPCKTTVVGGNQALLSTDPIWLSSLTVKNSGAYSYNNTLLVNSNSYQTASTNAYFDSYAISTDTYTARAENVNLALMTNMYGSLAMSISTTGQSTGTTSLGTISAKPNDKITYTVTLTNNSPSETLSEATIGFYVSDYFTNTSMTQSSGYTVSSTNDGVRSNYRCYTISNLIPLGGLAPGRSTSFTFTGNTSANVGTRLSCCAEVVSYRYASAVYDYYSIPGNMTLGTKKENDEAVATNVDVNTEAATYNTSNISITTSGRTFTLAQGESCEFDVIVHNVSDTSAYRISPNISPAVLLTKWVPTVTQVGSDMLLHFSVTANSSNVGGVAAFLIYIPNTSISATISVTVQKRQ